MLEVVYRALIKFTLTLSIAAMGGASIWWVWTSSESSRSIAKLEQQKQELQVQKQQLEEVVSRLGTEKRVADLIVTGRKTVAGKTRTELLFVEYNRAGKPMEPRQFSIDGVMAHVDAMVIEFEKNDVIKNDPLTGHAIALFTRIFGEDQAPSSANIVDSPGNIPAFYQSSDPKTADFEQKLWRTFWQLSSDEKLRQEMGVKVAIGKGVWGPFEPDTLYTITLTPDGNLSRTSEPMRGVYQTYIQMLRQKLTTTAENQ